MKLLTGTHINKKLMPPQIVGQLRVECRREDVPLLDGYDDWESLRCVFSPRDGGIW
jgi:hypothetical protein